MLSYAVRPYIIVGNKSVIRGCVMDGVDIRVRGRDYEITRNLIRDTLPKQVLCKHCNHPVDLAENDDVTALS